MIETHDIEGLPDLPSFTMDRGSGTITIEPCPNGEHWHWLFEPFVPPPPRQVPLEGYYEVSPEGPKPVMQTVEWTPQVSHLITDHIVSAMNPDECKLFLGWCSHVHQQLQTHMAFLAQAITEAVEGRQWSAVAKLAEELHVACQIQSHVGGAGRAVFDLTDTASTS